LMSDDRDVWVGCVLGILGAAFFIFVTLAWWPLLLYSWHYWFG
jgi:hypothetical protein